MSPRITPPTTSLEMSPASPAEAQSPPDHDNPGKLELSVLALSCGPLQQQITKLESFALSEEQLRTGHDGSPMQDKYAEFLEIVNFVLSELDADDDIEFAVGNRDTVSRVQSYIRAVDQEIKQLCASSSGITARNNVEQSGTYSHALLVDSWKKVEQMSQKLTLHTSVSSDWVDCQSSLDAVQTEEKDIAAMIFMMEEQRHTALQVPCVELDVLTTILEDLPEGENTGTPGKKVRNDGLSQWERTLSETILKLTSKLSPLRASISMFAPRLESFVGRAEEQFPSAVSALRARYAQLSTGFESLMDDFRRLKDELNEDKWLAVFRQVNKQASEMMNSLQRTLKSLEATPFHSVEAARLMSNFDLKTEHYGHAVPAVMSVMHRGVQDRLTLNGEILRGYELLTSRWKQMKLDIADMERRIQGARSAGIIHTAARSYQRDIQIDKHLRPLSQTQQNSFQVSLRESSSLRIGKSAAQKTPTRPSTSTPPRTRRQTRTVSLEQSSNTTSSFLFRKDISMDPPRSRSRLGYASDLKSPLPQSTRPPWNAGTNFRVLDNANKSPGTSPGSKSLRSASRLSAGRSGAASSLEVKRPHTPNFAGDRRLTTSFLPLKSPHKTAMTHKTTAVVPQLPSTPSKETIDRLSRPKVPQLGVAANKAVFAPTTPSRLRSGLMATSTPTSIPVARRMVSNPERSSPSKLRSVSAAGIRPHIRPASVLGDRRQSNIPMPTPQKVSNTWKH